MSSAMPSVLRKGALVRVAGASDEADVQAWALAFLDVRFPDGHVERWLGPGSLGARPPTMGDLQNWARQTCDEFAFEVACDIARHFTLERPPSLDDLQCEEVVVEWRASMPSEA